MTAKERRLWILFRITPEEQDKIEEFQRKHKRLSRLLGKHNNTDHDHASGLIRGRLEWRINKAYGLVEKAFPEDCADVLEALAEYHRNPPAPQALGEERYGLIGLAKIDKKKKIYGPPKG